MFIFLRGLWRRWTGGSALVTVNFIRSEFAPRKPSMVFTERAPSLMFTVRAPSITFTNVD